MALPWDEALAIPVLANLLHEEQSKLIQLAERFLQQKRLVPLQGFELDPLKNSRIALLFCLPVLELGIEWLDGFHEVLIYPAPFIVDDEWEDDIGLVHNQRMVQSGQSWQQGPIILNWLDIQDSFDASGFNLIIHEVAHKLDTRNGDRASGVPLIPLREVAGWEHDLHAAMEAAAAEGNIAEYYRNNYLSHETVQHYAGNPWLIRITHDLHRILKMHRGRQLLTPGRTAQSLAEHRELMECFRRRDAQAAERTMERHLLSQGQALAAYVAAGGLLNVPAPLPTEGGG